LRIEFTAFARGLSLLAGIVVLVKPRTSASAFAMITRRARTGCDIGNEADAANEPRNVRKLDSFMVLIFVVLTEIRKELRILFFSERPSPTVGLSPTQVSSKDEVSKIDIAVGAKLPMLGSENSQTNIEDADHCDSKREAC
jgi:hypothetical protein